jgi:hypothetical protein
MPSFFFAFFTILITLLVCFHLSLVLKVSTILRSLLDIFGVKGRVLCFSSQYICATY